VSFDAEAILRKVTRSKIIWDSPAPSQLEVDILKEYFRRQALWIKNLNLKIPLLGDLAEALDPKFKSKLDPIFQSEIEIGEIPLRSAPLLWNCIKFYELLEKRDVLCEFNLQNPYEIIVALFAKRRWFYKETGGIQFGTAWISLRPGIEGFAGREPLDANYLKEYESI
jgi:hypothetical protein